MAPPSFTSNPLQCVAQKQINSSLFHPSTSPAAPTTNSYAALAPFPPNTPASANSTSAAVQLTEVSPPLLPHFCALCLYSSPFHLRPLLTPSRRRRSWASAPAALTHIPPCPYLPSIGYASPLHPFASLSSCSPLTADGRTQHKHPGPQRQFQRLFPFEFPQDTMDGNTRAWRLCTLIPLPCAHAFASQLRSHRAAALHVSLPHAALSFPPFLQIREQRRHLDDAE
jgi:hypothetical protein